MVSKTNKMDVLTLSVVRVFTACLLCSYLSTADPDLAPETKAVMYFQKYGYMKKTDSSFPAGSSPILEEAPFSQAIKDFQNLVGLDETGELDEPTLNMMSKPRCGVPDYVGNTGTSWRKKRYTLHGTRWNKKSVTYRITKYPKLIEDKAKVEEEIARAFKVWSDVSGLNFEVSEDSSWFFNPVDIEIRFEEGKHGNKSDEFDGPGGTLAHAFTPEHGGDVHFDDAEKWTIRNFRGTNLFQVAVHEFGHSLGLLHSRIKTAVMYPLYSYKSDFTLDKDDVIGIQELYGPPMKDAAPDLCRYPSIDAATNTMDGHIYVFKEKYYWKIGETGIIDGYPRKISDDWPGLPGNLDAALTGPNGKTYFFKNNQYWRFYNNKGLDSGYPKEISAGFPGIPDDIDTAFLWNDEIYFFKDDEYRYCSFDSEGILNCFLQSQPIRDFWKGLPIYIDAALQWKNETYFFKGSKYYRINDTTHSTVDEADPPYPRSTSIWLFGCPDLCQDSSIDAAATTDNGQTYVFKGNYYWGIKETGISEGYPRKISNDWSGLPGDLDAAMTGANGKTYFFKKNQYWRFHNNILDSGYPKYISDGFQGIPNDIDFAWSLNDKAYFFKGDYYWGYAPHERDHYPQRISNWQGLPNNIDAALRWRNITYFFKGSQYYRWNDETASVAIADPPYPRSSYLRWFNCEDWKRPVKK